MSHLHICFGPPLTDEKPENWMDVGYRILVPYPFDWREKLGKATCDCTMVFETDRPWLGRHWTHHPDCAIEEHLRRYPGIYNFVENAGGMFAHTE